MLRPTFNDVACCLQNTSTPLRRNLSSIPGDIVGNSELQEAIRLSLPQNYEFEIEKTLWRIRQDNARHVGLQFPEGLLLFASQIATILSHFSSTPIDVTIMGDVTYGACCIDDLTAQSVGIDLLVHYGHSCLIPLDQTALKCLYIFVDIAIDYRPLLDCIVANFPPCQPPPSSGCVASNDSDAPTSTADSGPVIALLGTVQYSSVVHSAKKALQQVYGAENIIVPQESPLTAGEVLGCTSPVLVNNDSISSSRTLRQRSPDVTVFIADGRFHLESAMIQNPSLEFYRYDPFLKTLTHERYAHTEFHMNRQQAIHKARAAQHVGLILGTLGRQGSVGIFERLQELLRNRNVRTTLFLMSEILPHRIEALSSSVDAFVQVACPRLSIDWGHAFGAVPVLTPYEAYVAFGDQPYTSVYPMDYYSKGGGIWTNFASGFHRHGSLGHPSTSSTSLTDLEQRRALIRQRAEERRRRKQQLEAASTGD